MKAQPAAITAALAQAAVAINSTETLEETLDAIVHAARGSIPGFDHIGISITHPSGRIETKAATGRLVWELDDLQYGIGEGPCVQAITDEPLVVVEHARHEQRWPRYIPSAVKSGLQSQLAVKLYFHEETLGGLNLYSTTSETIGPEAIDLAELFATHAAIALGHARREHHLNQALLTRQTIGQAVGLLMQRYQIDSDRAFQFLVRASSHENIKLRDVAAEIVASANSRFARDEPA